MTGRPYGALAPLRRKLMKVVYKAMVKRLPGKSSSFPMVVCRIGAWQLAAHDKIEGVSFGCDPGYHGLLHHEAVCSTTLLDLFSLLHHEAV